MRYDAVVSLVAVTYTTDAIGQPVEAKTPREVFANEFEVSSREYYDAGAQGLKAECRYQVRSADYDGERLLVVGDTEHNIIRVARKGEWTLLTCERTVGNG